jgi:hypothetical protein
MKEKPMTPLNLDDIMVINLRPLPSGNVEALLRVSKRDYDRLLADHSGMHYSIPANMTGRVSKESLFDAVRPNYVMGLMDAAQAAGEAAAAAREELTVTVNLPLDKNSWDIE